VMQTSGSGYAATSAPISFEPSSAIFELGMELVCNKEMQLRSTEWVQINQKVNVASRGPVLVGVTGNDHSRSCRPSWFDLIIRCCDARKASQRRSLWDKSGVVQWLMSSRFGPPCHRAK
jgi:hypothetical protein